MSNRRRFLLAGSALWITLATITALSGCEGEPPHCPPPIGCAR